MQTQFCTVVFEQLGVPVTVQQVPLPCGILQTPPEQLPLQQSALVEQVRPSALQLEHRPFLQERPLQQSVLTEQLWPEALQLCLHRPLWQVRPVQQSEFTEQLAFCMLHGFAQRPPVHCRPEQQSEFSEHDEPWGLHALPQTPLLQAPLQHSSPDWQAWPSDRQQ
jgi:hypothetical protein